MTDRARLTLNLALCFLHRRGCGLVVNSFPLTWTESIEHELKVTPQERDEAIEMADDLEEYFK